MKYIVDNNQSIWDIALQVYGDVSGVEWLIFDNPGVVNFENELEAGTEIQLREAIINASVVEIFKKINYKPATAFEGSYGAFTNGFNIGNL